MREKTIDLRKLDFAQASRAITRLRSFIRRKNYPILLVFKVPPRKKVHVVSKIKQDKFCPYCGSHIIQSPVGRICNGDNLTNIAHEIRRLRYIHGQSAELFLNAQQNRFYDQYLYYGRALSCGYIEGLDERKFGKV